MKKVFFRVFVSLILCGLSAGCSFFSKMNFNGIYTIGGREYKSIEFFSKYLTGNRDFYSAGNLYEGDFVTSNGENCKKIKHPVFDLYEISNPKSESYVSVIVCNSQDFDNFVSFYSDNRNNNFFVGQLRGTSNYVSECTAIYKVSDAVFPSENQNFKDLMDFCKKYEVTPYSSRKTKDIEKEADCYSAADFANDVIVKIFRTSKDGYFYSNRSESFLYKNGKLSLFCVNDGEKYYFMPLTSTLNSSFVSAVANSLTGGSGSAIKISDYPEGYFFRIQ